MEDEVLDTTQENSELSKQEQQEFAQFLAQLFKVKTAEELQTRIEAETKKDPKFIQKAYQAYQSYKEKTASGSSAAIAKLGMKFNYVNKLNGRCPKGYTVFKKGGCLKCKKQKQDKSIANIKAQIINKKRFSQNQDDSRGSFMKNGIQ